MNGSLDSLTFTPYPYPGLRPFNQSERDIFFGREEQVDQILAKLELSRLVAVIGPSGCGKSSLVRAGVVPAVESGELSSAGLYWRTATMKPGRRPLLHLAQTLVKAGLIESTSGEPDEDIAFLEATLSRGSLGLIDALGHSTLREHDNLLLVVDQFEELFRFERLHEPGEARAFVGLLLATAREPNVNVYIVITMRSDFLGKCPIFAGLPEAMNDSQFLTPRLSRDQTRAAIAGPLAPFDCEIDDLVVNRISNQMGRDPGQLPLMQHLLLRMWEKASTAERSIEQPKAIGRTRLTMQHYEQCGTLDNALEKHVSSIYDRLSDRQKHIAECLFRQLTEITSDGHMIRRPTVLGEICDMQIGSDDEIIGVVDKFRAQGRCFLVPPAPEALSRTSTIDISHERLISQWKLLKEWTKDEDRSRKVAAVVHNEAIRWREAGKCPEGLLVGLQLAEALEWSQNHPRDVGPLEREFLDESQELRESAIRRDEALKYTEELEQKTRKLETAHSRLKNRANWIAGLGFGIAALFLILLGAVSSMYVKLQSASYKVQSALCEVQSAWCEENRQRVKLLITHGVHASESGRPARATLWYSEALTKDHEGSEVTEEAKIVHSTRIAAGLRQCAPLARLWRQEPEDVEGLSDREKFQTRNAMFISDGKSDDLWVLAANGDLQGKQGVARMWNVASGKEWGSCYSERNVRVTWATATNDWVATAGASPASDIGRVGIWDRQTGDEKRHFRLRGAVNHIALCPSGRYLAMGSGKAGTSDGELRVWDSHHPIRPPVALSFKGPVSWVAFSPENAEPLRIAAGGALGDRGICRVWDMDNLSEPRLEIKHLSRVNRVAFSPDGSLIASVSGLQGAETGEVQVWDVDSRDAFLSPIGPRQGFTSVDFSSCGKMLLTADHAGTAILWDVRDGRWGTRKGRRKIYLHSVQHGSSVYDVKFSPDGRYFATGSRDRTARVWETATGEPAFPPLNHTGTVVALQFSPNGRYLLTVSKDIVRLWDLARPSCTQRLYPIKGDFRKLACSPDVKFGVTASKGLGYEAGVGQVWNLTKDPNSIDLPSEITFAAISNLLPTGRRLVTADAGGLIKLTEVVQGKLLESTRVSHVKQIAGLAISPDGRYVAAAIGDIMDTVGSARVWRVRDGGKITEIVLQGEKHLGGVIDIAFDKDGKYMVTASADDTARVWDLESGKPTGHELWHTADVLHASFSDDGRLVATASRDNTAAIWDWKEQEKTHGDREARRTRALKLATLAHGGYVTHARFSQNDQYLMTACHDQFARIWHLPGSCSFDEPESTYSPELVASVHHGEGLKFAAFEDNAKRLITVGEYRPKLVSKIAPTPALTRHHVRVRLWNLSMEPLSIEQSKDYAALLSARKFNSSRQDTEELTAGELAKIWATLQTTFGVDFSWEPNQLEKDAIRLDKEARECEAVGQWHGARWYLDRMISSSTEDADLYFRRAMAFGECEEWERVVEDAMIANDLLSTRLGPATDGTELTTELQATMSRVREFLALAQLKLNRIDDYRRTSTDTPRAVDGAKQLLAANRAVWTCVIVPDQLDEMLIESLVGTAKKVVEQAQQSSKDSSQLPILHRSLNTLGAAYYRKAMLHLHAGDTSRGKEALKNAIKNLQMSDQKYNSYTAAISSRAVQEDEIGGKIWNWLFLSMAHHQLGDAANASRYRNKVEKAMNKEKAHGFARATGVPAMEWPQRVALTLLESEAFKVLDQTPLLEPGPGKGPT